MHLNLIVITQNIKLFEIFSSDILLKLLELFQTLRLNMFLSPIWVKNLRSQRWHLILSLLSCSIIIIRYFVGSKILVKYSFLKTQIFSQKYIKRILIYYCWGCSWLRRKRTQYWLSLCQILSIISSLYITLMPLNSSLW